MNLLNLLLKALMGDSSLSALMKKTGLSAAKLKKLIPLAVPLLLKYLTNNASNEGGALSLLGALGQHGGNKALPAQIAEADETDGGKILGHILGKDKDPAMQNLATQTGMSKDFNDFELQSALANRNIFRANQIVKYFQSNPRSFFITRTLTNLFTFFSDIMLAYYAPDKTDASIAAWLGKSEWKVRQDIGPARRNYSGVKVMQILGEIRKTDAQSKGVGGCRTPHEELLQDLIFFILH